MSADKEVKPDDFESVTPRVKQMGDLFRNMTYREAMQVGTMFSDELNGTPDSQGMADVLLKVGDRIKMAHEIKT
jgi:hypothetical protein